MSARIDTWLVAYDIRDDRRRNRLHRTLKGYGEALQKSVFLCRLTAAKVRRMQADLAEFEGEPTDRIDCIPVAAHAALPAPDSLWILE